MTHLPRASVLFTCFGFFQLRKCDHLRSRRACSACSFKPVYFCGMMIIPLKLKVCVCVCVSAPTYAGVITISPLSYSYPCRDTSLKVRGSFTILFKSRVVHLDIHTRSCSCMRHSHTHKQTPLHKYVSSLSWPHFEGFISF